ncbi:leucine-rich repeats and immunoglobulin-like domains protein 1 [Lingula anatina]|uniref:Leucine-rich repeats and immunoglobulin-like domains protein 1 n=1 Tax=Lingula anatina TaxID=7574 RepID=A0A1S3JI39_LINAN|nr:leucine-rich repeats and immunoglobulin-like domains protein 1 [Lingula anatina]|eukprot:XP_013410057.1 leucine-rich repeats and immunoglobulin-like domains protein 1 [Lingula anatina]
MTFLYSLPGQDCRDQPGSAGRYTKYESYGSTTEDAKCICLEGWEWDKKLHACKQSSGHTADGKAYPMTNKAPVPMCNTAPEPVVVLEGEKMTLNCDCSEKPDPTIRWNKLAANGTEMPWPDGIVDKIPSLFIPYVTFDHEGTYRCTGSNGSWSIVVVVEAAPYWTKPGRPKDTNVTLTAGDDFTFECDAEGIPTPDKPKFYSNGLELDLSDPRIGYDEQELTKFTLKNVSKDDIQAFQCNVSNKHGYLSRSINLNVLHRTQLLVDPEQKIVFEADNKPTSVRFNCSARGDPSTPLNFTWLYRHASSSSPDTEKWMPLLSEGPYTFIKDNEHTMDLNISLEKGPVHDQYKCVVDNGHVPVEVLASLRQRDTGTKKTDASEKEGLSPDAIIGIVIASMTVVFLIFLDILCCFKYNCGVLMCLCTHLRGKEMPCGPANCKIADVENGTGDEKQNLKGDTETADCEDKKPDAGPEEIELEEKTPQ